MTDRYLAPEEAQIRSLAERDGSGPVVMVNLLKFRDRATEPAEGSTGAEAYGEYSTRVEPMLARVGGRVITALRCDEGVIGPADPEWDMVIVVEYPSPSAFLEMIGSAEYLEAHPYRAAALDDSRLVASTGLTT